jgi:hypothetical protein
MGVKGRHVSAQPLLATSHATGKMDAMPALSLNEMIAAMSCSPKIVMAVRAACSTRLSREYSGPCSDALVLDAACAMLPLQRQLFRLNKNGSDCQC